MLEEKDKNVGIRLNRYLGNSGICTRREADKLITKGLVEVNGKVVKEMGYKVQPGEIVTYLGETLNAESRQYILVNKPKESVSTKKKSRGQRSIYDITEYACYEEITPLSPLAINTTGLILMTNDFELAKKLKQEKREIYHIFLKDDMTDEGLVKLRKGFKIKGQLIKPDEAHYANDNNKKEVGLEIHSVSDIDIIKMVESCGFKIDRLDRVVFAGLTKKNLSRGKWRALSKKEIQYLKMQ